MWIFRADRNEPVWVGPAQPGKGIGGAPGLGGGPPGSPGKKKGKRDSGGGGDGGAAYRYYRLYVTANNGNVSWAGAHTLALRESAGGADVTQEGGSAFGGPTTVSIGLPPHAFDDDDATGWVYPIYASPLPGWVGWDFGEGNDRVIAAYSVGSYHSATDTAERSPRDWVFQGSNDDAVWNDLDTVTGEAGWTLGELRTFTVT